MIEWDVPFRLLTTSGTLYFNEPDLTISPNGFFALRQEGCKATRDLRIVSDNVPQSDGEIFHKRFRSGTEVQLQVQLWQNAEEFACNEVLRAMFEELLGHLDALVNNPGRLFWQPSGYGDERFLESCRYLSPIDVSYEVGVPTITFKLDSPLPYVLDKTPITIGGTPNTVELPANTTVDIMMPQFGTNFWPVIHVYGASSGFTIVNFSVQDEFGDDLKIVYSGSRPGAQDIGSAEYAEIVCFNETIYLNGNEDNLKPGIDPEFTDFFFLGPGLNQVAISGADAHMNVNYAWPVA